ncbi:uncharacterized protein LOC113146998 [Cyclospora cayetanensis]|uniref:Uncharacterized protein LOC113146998 n=1 Tax=Cyclospora cayetanensis TaxID=88456 RepID=A0A6P6RWD0_9EIME|nr:uncharacterized protein LOC113146998 [Cyclospora cayetanensis]
MVHSISNTPCAIAFLRGPQVLYQLEHPLLHLGRARTCDINIRSGSISRFHAALDLTGLQNIGTCKHLGPKTLAPELLPLVCVEGDARAPKVYQREGSFFGRAFVKDLASLNGTWLNKRRLEPHVWYPLENGDAITFSSSEEGYLVFEIPEGQGHSRTTELKEECGTAHQNCKSLIVPGRERELSQNIGQDKDNPRECISPRTSRCPTQHVSPPPASSRKARKTPNKVAFSSKSIPIKTAAIKEGHAIREETTDPNGTRATCPNVASNREFESTESNIKAQACPRLPAPIFSSLSPGGPRTNERVLRGASQASGKQLQRAKETEEVSSEKRFAVSTKCTGDLSCCFSSFGNEGGDDQPLNTAGIRNVASYHQQYRCTGVALPEDTLPNFKTSMDALSRFRTDAHEIPFARCPHTKAALLGSPKHKHTADPHVQKTSRETQHTPALGISCSSCGCTPSLLGHGSCHSCNGEKLHIPPHVSNSRASCRACHVPKVSQPHSRDRIESRGLANQCTRLACRGTFNCSCANIHWARRALPSFGASTIAPVGLQQQPSQNEGCITFDAVKSAPTNLESRSLPIYTFDCSSHCTYSCSPRRNASGYFPELISLPDSDPTVPIATRSLHSYFPSPFVACPSAAHYSKSRQVAARGPLLQPILQRAGKPAGLPGWSPQPVARQAASRIFLGGLYAESHSRYQREAEKASPYVRPEQTQEQLSAVLTRSLRRGPAAFSTVRLADEISLFSAAKLSENPRTHAKKCTSACGTAGIQVQPKKNSRSSNAPSSTNPACSLKPLLSYETDTIQHQTTADGKVSAAAAACSLLRGSVLSKCPQGRSTTAERTLEIQQMAIGQQDPREKQASRLNPIGCRSRTPGCSSTFAM